MRLHEFNIGTVFTNTVNGYTFRIVSDLALHCYRLQEINTFDIWPYQYDTLGEIYTRHHKNAVKVSP